MDYLCDSINALFKSLMFPNSLKLADVTPIHKKGMKELEGGYRWVSIIPTLSKMFERIMFVQISASFGNVFWKCQCGFRKSYSTQHCNLKMLEKWKECVAKEKIFGILLTEISRVFDFLDHKSFRDKLNAYSFNLQALRLVHGNLSNRKQRIKT